MSVLCLLPIVSHMSNYQTKLNYTVFQCNIKRLILRILESLFEQFSKMTKYERAKHFATLTLLLLFALLFGFPAIIKLLDDETVFIEEKSKYLSILSKDILETRHRSIRLKVNGAKPSVYKITIEYF